MLFGVYLCNISVKMCEETTHNNEEFGGIDQNFFFLRWILVRPKILGFLPLFCLQFPPAPKDISWIGPLMRWFFAFFILYLSGNGIENALLFDSLKLKYGFIPNNDCDPLNISKVGTWWKGSMLDLILWMVSGIV